MQAIDPELAFDIFDMLTAASASSAPAAAAADDAAAEESSSQPWCSTVNGTVDRAEQPSKKAQVHVIECGLR